ncbi:MAG: autotransporter domain-containing protein, partial [Maritimibacter sp.]
TGNLIVENNGYVDIANELYVGIVGDSNGSVTVSSGGMVSAGVFVIDGSSNVDYGSLYIGSKSGGNPAAAGTLVGDVNLQSSYGQLVFNHTDTDYTFSNTLLGSGKVIFRDGTTRLTSDLGNFVGSFSLSGGTLLMNSDSSVGMYVNDGATLGGTGTMGGITVDTGGTLAPGDNGIGTMGMLNLIFAEGSTYEVQVNDGGNVAGTNNDRVLVDGNLYVDGGAVHVTAENGADDGSTYTPGTQYTILSSGTAVIGTFNSVSDEFTFLDASLSYDATNVYLTLNEAAGDSGVFSTVATTPNQQATAGALNGLGSGNAVYDALILSTNEDDARDAMDQLSGDGHASAAAAGISDTRFLRQASLNRLRVTGQGGQQAQGGEVMSSMGSDNSLPISVWGTGYGEWQRLNNDGNNAGILTRMSAGLYIGGDMQLGNGLTFGVLGGIGHSSDSIASRNMTGSSTSYELGVYGGGSFGNVDVSFGAGQTWYDIATERNVAFGGFTDTLSASYKARATQVFGEVGYRFDLKDVTIEPFAGAALVHMSTDAFSETGGAAALSSAASSSNTGFTTLGLRGETDMPGMDGVTLTGSLAWRHAFGSTSSASTMTLNGGAGAFAVSGDTIGRDTALFDLGADFALNDSSTLNVSYSGEFGAGIQKHGLSARFEMKF